MNLVKLNHPIYKQCPCAFCVLGYHLELLWEYQDLPLIWVETFYDEA